MKIFDCNKRWYKGNLHTHTTVSDGLLEPQECMERYRQKGYSFLALTDHREYFEGRFDDEDFIVLPGEEFMHEDFNRWTAYHIIGINQNSHFETDNDTDPQYIIDEIKKRGGMAIMGHPAWSLMSHEEIRELRGLDALEIFSGISEEYSGRGYSSNYADVLATMGMPLKLFSVDDMHFEGRDLFRCWIMLQTDDFTREGLVDALYKGSFYASEGPRILNLEVDNGRVMIDTSEVEKIYFLTNTWYNAKRVLVKEDGSPITHAQYEIVPQDDWLRIEGTDFNGKKFTTNFISLNDKN